MRIQNRHERIVSAPRERIWSERIEPLHDLILEALLDNVQAEAAAGA
jgi:hypothetical protein